MCFRYTPNDPTATQTATLSLHDALPISIHLELERELADWYGEEDALVYTTGYLANTGCIATLLDPGDTVICDAGDRKSTRLNSSHRCISYAVFCLKKKNMQTDTSLREDA